MAIKKSISDNKGQIVTYHRILAFAPVYLSGEEAVNVNLASYTSEEYRALEKDGKGDKMQVTSVAITFPLEDTDEYSRELLYKKIMELPEWEGSEMI